MILHSLIFVTLILQIRSQTDQCYAKIESPYLNFSERTAYHVTSGFEMNTPLGCEPIYVWSLIRHGTRYPEIEFIKSVNKLYTLKDEIIKNHKNGRGNLCEEDLRNLAHWSSKMPDSVEQGDRDLAPQGFKDHASLARKMKEVFPKLLKSSTRDKFTFQSSDRNRTKDSAVAFTNELLGTNFKTTMGNNITENPELLQLVEHCPKFSKLEKDPASLTEANLFAETPHFKKIIAEISIRLGYLQSLSFDSIMLIYDSCSYESAWFLGSRPPFCAAFSQSDLESLDYRFDLFRYYTRGYGNSLSYQLGCPIVQDMLKSLKYAANASQTRKGKFLFSHSETIYPAIVRLGLFKDNETLRHDNYQKMIKQRVCRQSQFNSFAANIVAVVYRCYRENGNQTKVSIYQNEWAVKFSECDYSDLCDLETLLQKYSDVFDENKCNLNFCAVSDRMDKPNEHSGSAKLSQWSLSIFALVQSIMIFIVLLVI